MCFVLARYQINFSLVNMKDMLYVNMNMAISILKLSE